MRVSEEYSSALNRVRSVAAMLTGEADRIARDGEERDARGGVISDPYAVILSETLRLWAQVLSNTHIQEAFARGGGSSDASWVDANHLDLLETQVPSVLPQDRPRVRALGSQLRTGLSSIFKRPDLNHPLVFADGDATAFLQFQLSILTELARLEEEILDSAVSRANTAAVQSEVAATDASRAAGKTGSTVMSASYALLASREQKAANWFRAATIATAAFAAASAWAFISNPGLLQVPVLGSDDYVHLIQRGVFVAGVFGIAGYFARQAHQHRSMANWAAALSVQLMTFDAFVSPVHDPSVSDELRRTFAERAFGDHPPMKGEPTVTSSGAVMDAAVDLAAKFTGAGSK